MNAIVNAVCELSRWSWNVHYMLFPWFVCFFRHWADDHRHPAISAPFMILGILVALVWLISTPLILIGALAAASNGSSGLAVFLLSLGLFWLMGQIRCYFYDLRTYPHSWR